MSSTKGLTCLRSERMIVDFENLDKVAPKEEQIKSKASIRFIIDLLYFHKKDTSKNCIKLISVVLYQEVNKGS